MPIAKFVENGIKDICSLAIFITYFIIYKVVIANILIKYKVVIVNILIKYKLVIVNILIK